ncbi:hypothetical protein [Brenneria uluponensis]|uniref:hypothetical protein n=1 Tax=Brenneria uluponensis TaxID=3057057 RepID=UPI0028E33E35|nr:hypothetical protein [Brenneria ulupoensis]
MFSVSTPRFIAALGVLLARRDNVYQAARAANPKRWSRQTRNWQRQDSVTLNPEGDKQAVYINLG